MPEKAASVDGLAAALGAAEDDAAEVDGVDAAAVADGADGADASDETDERATDSRASLDHPPHTLGDGRRVHSDALYGALPVSRWAQALLNLEPFARLAGVSLSDAPGRLLFHRSFPSRRTHSLGVYYLARQARPRDRALHAAALAHDLGHGPFSHLTEPLMIERLGMNHEQRGALALRQALTGLRGPSAQLLAWLDPDEVAELMLGGGPAGRGQLLNGLIDYDNLDHVARFLQAAELGVPSYDPRTLARELRLASPTVDAANARAQQSVVALGSDATKQAQGWLADRRRVYRFLGESTRNLAIRGMLRKAIDLAAQAGVIAPSFFDATDAQALDLLRASHASGATALADAVLSDCLYTPAWEATAPDEADALPEIFAHAHSRLAIEERIATEAALLPHEVVLSYSVARGERELPPIIATERGRAEPASNLPVLPGGAHAPERSIQLFVTRTAGRDYVRRARMAAERALGNLGALPSIRADLHPFG